MAKKSGGTRNYRNKPETLAKRRKQFDGILATGVYSESYFDPSGGYYVVHEEHRVKEDASSKERFAASTLASRGYRVFLMPDQSYVEGLSKTDGFAEHAMMDIKTINSAGASTIKRAMEKASKQGAELMVLVPNSESITKEYITEQMQKFRDSSSGRRNSTLKAIWVISRDGERLHRRPV